MIQTAIQIDLHGGAAECRPKITKSMHMTMQQLHGAKDGHACRDCAHLVKIRIGAAVHKCVKWKFTPNPASDIDPAQTACGRFRPY